MRATELASSTDFGMAPFRYLPHVFFVQKFGLDDFEAAMQVQYQLTKRFSAESSIRAFLVRYPDATLTRLQQWTRDPSVHVRRLVSEGTRPRLSGKISFADLTTRRHYAGRHRIDLVVNGVTHPLAEFEVRA